MGSTVFQRSAGVRTATAVRGQVPAETPGPASGRLGQAERAVQARPGPGVRLSAGVRQVGRSARSGPALRAGRRPPDTVVRHVIRGPVRVRAGLPTGRQLFRQRRGPTERHRRVHARFRVPVQGHPAVRLPVASAHQLCALRPSDRCRCRRRPHDRQTDDGQYELYY